MQYPRCWGTSLNTLRQLLEDLKNKTDIRNPSAFICSAVSPPQIPTRPLQFSNLVQLESAACLRTLDHVPEPEKVPRLLGGFRRSALFKTHLCREFITVLSLQVRSRVRICPAAASSQQPAATKSPPKLWRIFEFFMKDIPGNEKRTVPKS